MPASWLEVFDCPVLRAVSLAKYMRYWTPCILFCFWCPAFWCCHSCSYRICTVSGQAECLLINKLNRSCSFLFNTMVSWLKNRNGRQVLACCTGYAVLPHQVFLSGWMPQNPVAEDPVLLSDISKKWYFLCRRLATVVDVWGCRQLSVTWVTVFTAYTSVIRPLSCRLYMDGTVFRFLYVWCNNVPDVGDRKNFGLIRVYGTTGQVCFCALFPGQFALCTQYFVFPIRNQVSWFFQTGVFHLQIFRIFVSGLELMKRFDTLSSDTNVSVCSLH